MALARNALLCTFKLFSFFSSFLLAPARYFDLLGFSPPCSRIYDIHLAFVGYELLISWLVWVCYIRPPRGALWKPNWGLQGLNADGMDYEVRSSMQVLGYLLLGALIGHGFELWPYYIFFFFYLSWLPFRLRAYVHSYKHYQISHGASPRGTVLNPGWVGQTLPDFCTASFGPILHHFYFSLLEGEAAHSIQATCRSTGDPQVSMFLLFSTFLFFFSSLDFSLFLVCYLFCFSWRLLGLIALSG